MRTTALKVGRVLLWLVYLWVAITQVLLVLAFFLQLFGANPTAGFVQWVYRSTQRAMAPFRGIFESVPLSDESVLDVSVLFAMIVYGFIAFGLHLAIDWLTATLQTEERREQHQQALAAQAATQVPRQVVQLAAPTGAAASAVLTPQYWGTSIELSASGLEPWRSYNVWLEGRGGGRVSAGMVQPNATGALRVTLNSSTPLADCHAFGLSLIPGPGETAGADILATQLV
jgi:uncharacterized protein YggT (Ycf19 family)